jgi:tetratricopeptide (TPR) repeat protein
MNEQAIAICTAILKQYPQHEDTRLLRVAIYLFEQDMDGARQCLDEGIALNPQSQALLYQKNLLDSKTPEDRRQLRVEYLTKVYQGAELERQLSELYEQFPDPNDPGAALAHLEKAVELDPSNLLVTRKLFYTELIRKDENGKHIGFEKAEAVMEKAKVFGPDETDLMRAGMLKEKGNNDPTTPEFKEAIGIMKDALARHETFSEGHAVLGELYLDSRNLQEARTQLNRSYELNPTQVGALINLARLAALENRPEDHEKWINLAWRYAPNDAYVRNNWLAYQERHAATNDQINALIQYGEQLASRDTQDVENWGRLARLYMKADPPRREAAGQIYAELYRNFQGKEPRGGRPGSLQFLELYLSYLRLTDQAPAGLQKLEEVADKEPDKVGYFVVYGNYLAALGNTDKALESFNAALAKDSNDRRPYLAKSLVQIDLKNWDGAVSTLRDGVRALPDERDMKVMLVNVLLQSEQFESARQAAAEMTKANPNDMGALVLEGRALQLAGHIDEARAKYDKVLTSNPNAGEALRFRAWTFIATGQFAAAVKDLVALSHVRPDPATVSEIARIQVMMKDLDGAKATLEEGLTVHENNPQIRQALVNVLILQSSQNSLEAAEAELHKGQEHDPNSSVFWMQEADMWRQRKEVDAPTRRVTALQKARGLSPNNPTVFIEYIDGLLDAGRFEELKQLSKEIKDPPPIIAIMMQVALGRAYLGTNNEADAANCFRQAYLACQGDEIGAVDSRVRKALGDQKLGDQKLVALLRQWLTEQDNWCMRLALARILRDSPDTRAQAAELLAGANLEGATNLAKMLVYQDLGTTLQDLKRTEEARKAYEAALALPDVKAPSLRATALNNLAYVLADDLNQPKQAVDFARQAMQLMPQSTDIMDTVGWSYYRAGQLNQAEHYLLQAIELTPSASYRYHLGMVQEAKGNKEEALRQYRLGFETVRDNPNDEQHRKIKERLAALGAP